MRVRRYNLTSTSGDVRITPAVTRDGKTALKTTPLSFPMWNEESECPTVDGFTLCADGLLKVNVNGVLSSIIRYYSVVKSEALTYLHYFTLNEDVLFWKQMGVLNIQAGVVTSIHVSSVWHCQCSHCNLFVSSWSSPPRHRFWGFDNWWNSGIGRFPSDVPHRCACFAS